MKNQSDLVFKVLSKLQKVEILDHVLLIGSWCAKFYESYFKGIDYFPRLMTRDIDFAVPRGARFSQEVDLEKLLASEGFEIEFLGDGYMRLESDQLMIEFLVPEVGRSTTKPYPLKALKWNAQPLRHLDMLWRDPIKIKLDQLIIHLPHPIDFCLNKLIVSGKRKNKDKQLKDLETAALILEALQVKGELEILKQVLKTLPKKEQKAVMLVLEKIEFKLYTAT